MFTVDPHIPDPCLAEYSDYPNYLVKGEKKSSEQDLTNHLEITLKKHNYHKKLSTV